jgi:hypothetical protein
MRARCNTVLRAMGPCDRERKGKNKPPAGLKTTTGGPYPHAILGHVAPYPRTWRWSIYAPTPSRAALPACSTLFGSPSGAFPKLEAAAISSRLCFAPLTGRPFSSKRRVLIAVKGLWTGRALRWEEKGSLCKGDIMTVLLCWTSKPPSGPGSILGSGYKREVVAAPTDGETQTTSRQYKRPCTRGMRDRPRRLRAPIGLRVLR